MSFISSSCLYGAHRSICGASYRGTAGAMRHPEERPRIPGAGLRRTPNGFCDKPMESAR